MRKRFLKEEADILQNIDKYKGKNKKVIITLVFYIPTYEFVSLSADLTIYICLIPAARI